jgi:hypothetical protein
MNSTVVSPHVPGAELGGLLDNRSRHPSKRSRDVVDNFAYLPAGAGIPTSSAGLTWGVFLLDNTRWFVASKVGNTLTNSAPISTALGGIDPHAFTDPLYDYPVNIGRAIRSRCVRSSSSSRRSRRS